MQLYSKEKNVSQPIEGHAAAFASLTLEGATTPSTLFTFATKAAAGAKVRAGPPPSTLPSSACRARVTCRCAGSARPRSSPCLLPWRRCATLTAAAEHGARLLVQHARLGTG